MFASGVPESRRVTVHDCGHTNVSAAVAPAVAFLTAETFRLDRCDDIRAAIVIDAMCARVDIVLSVSTLDRVPIDGCQARSIMLVTGMCVSAV